MKVFVIVDPGKVPEVSRGDLVSDRVGNCGFEFRIPDGVDFDSLRRIEITVDGFLDFGFSK